MHKSAMKLRMAFAPTWFLSLMFFTLRPHSYSSVTIAAAPATISVISCVIEACLALL